MNRISAQGTPHRNDARSDAALLVDATAGDRAAFHELFHRHAPALYSFVASRSGAADADDVVVETFEVAWRRRAEFDDRQPSARPWLFGIAVRVSLAHMAARSRWDRAAAHAVTERSSSQPIESSIDPELVAAMTHLSDSERTVLLLVAIGELSVHEAAGALGISAVAARVRLHRARTTLRKILDQQGGDR